jgi:2-hydroxy-6-oxonona-2,4-dienedioate hydrolase
LTVASNTSEAFGRGLNGEQAVRTSVWRVPGEVEGQVATVTDVGDGLPVVFLNGLVGLNEHWEAVVDRVKHRVRCILFQLPLLELRGDDCSIHGATRLTARFLGEYLNEPAMLVGNSFGGHVATRIAIEEPKHVRALTLAGASGLIEDSLVSDVQIRPSREWLRRKIGELFFDQRFMREADLERAYLELKERGNARAMVKLSRSARRDHLGDRITGVSCPTLLIWGRQDIVTPPEAAEGFNRMIRGSELVWFDQCGHAPMIECPDKFADELLRFAADLPALGGGGGGAGASAGYVGR